MAWNTDTTLEILKHARGLAHDVIARGPRLADDDALPVDIGCLLGTLSRLVRRYRRALDALEHEIPF